MPDAQASSLPHGPLTESAVHLCIDVQQMFAEQTAWHVPWMKRVVPLILRIARAFRRGRCSPGLFLRCVRLKLGAHGGAIISAGVNLPVSACPRNFSHCSRSCWNSFRRLRSSTNTSIPRSQSHNFTGILQDRGIDSVVISGGETDVCVLAAVLDAVDLGYRVVVASDALCSVSDEAHDNLLQLFSERFQQQIEVASSETILEAWV